MNASTPTKVGFVTNIYTPYKEAMFREIAKLVDLKVYYCANREQNRDWAVEFSGAYDYELLPGKTFYLGKRKLHFNPSLFSKIKKDSIDVMIVGEWCNPTVIIAPFWLRMKGIPRILWTGSTELESSLIRIFTNPLKRLIVAQYQSYVTYTRRAARYVNKLGAPMKNISVAPVTVDTDYFYGESEKLRQHPGRKSLRLQYSVKDDDIVVLFVGQLIYRKGIDILLKTIKSINNEKVILLLAGSGDERHEFENLCETLGISDRVFFVGHCTQHQLIQLYVLADIFTLPSRMEPSGNVINEAMTVGLPVIISDKIGCDCVMHGENGFIFSSENIKEYGKFLDILIINERLRDRMGLEARRRILHSFSIQNEALEFAKAVERTLISTGKRFVPLPRFEVMQGDVEG